MKCLKTLAIFVCLSTSAWADEETTPYKLDIQQAALTRQLNFTDQVADVYGRYLIARDSYFLGQTGVAQMSTNVYAEIDKWYQSWPNFIERLSFNTKAQISENLSGSGARKSLDSELSDRVTELEGIMNRYRQVLDRSRQGLGLVQGLPRLSTEEFQSLNDTEAQKVNLIRLKGIDPYVTKLNRNIDDLQNLFTESTQQLQRDLLDRLNSFKSDVTTIVQIKATLYNLEFPELEAAIARFEKVLSTDQAMDKIIADNILLYQRISNAILGADFLEAEAGLKKLSDTVDKGFLPFLRNPNFDRERVVEAQALTRLQLNDLQNRLSNTLAAKGGRREALIEFILTYSRTAAAYCGEKNGKLQPARYSLDCNLFKKNVAPFVMTLRGPQSNQISEPQIEVILKSLKNVFRGPLAEGKSQ